MKIDGTNYEQWAMDYIEGTLPPETRDAFGRFLSQYPDIARQIEELAGDMPVLPVETVVYPDKKALLRGGREVRLRRLGSFLSGAAAASVLVVLIAGIGRFQNRNEALIGYAGERAAAVKKEIRPEQAEIHKHPADDSMAEPLQTVRSGDAHETEAVSPGSGPTAGLRSADRPEPDCGARKPSVAVMAVATPAAKQAVSHGGGIEREEFIEYRHDTEAIAYPEIRTRASFRVEIPEELPGTAFRDEHSGREGRFGEAVRRSLASLLIPIDMINPIKTYRTDDGGGIEIASLVRIGTNENN